MEIPVPKEMRNVYMRQVILTLTALSASLALSAQNSSPSGTPPTPAQIAAHIVQRLTKLLNLDSSQQSSATTIFTDEQTTLAGLRGSLKSARSTLKTAIQSDDVSVIDAQAAQIGTLVGEEVKAESGAEAAFYALLTSSQKTAFNELHNGDLGYGGPGSFGGHGFGNH